MVKKLELNGQNSVTVYRRINELPNPKDYPNRSDGIAAFSKWRAAYLAWKQENGLGEDE